MKKCAIFFILIVSKLFRLSGLRACRFYPSCSEYSIEAFQKFSFMKAFWLAAKRVLSCHPLSPGGFQPLMGSDPSRRSLTPNTKV